MAIGLTYVDLQFCNGADNVAVTGYNIYSSDGTLIADVGLTNSYRVTGLVPDTEYCWYYTAYDEAGNESIPSNIICGRTRSAFNEQTFAFDIQVEAGDTFSLQTSYLDGNIIWGDGDLLEVSGAYTNPSNTYTNAGIYTVYINGRFPIFATSTYPMRDQIIDISQWGDIQAERMAFQNAANISVVSATDIPIFAPNFDAGYMFAGSAFNTDISDWDTSNVIQMDHMFYDTVFNHPINDWDVSNVTNMFNMFALSPAFNQPLNLWDVSNVTNMGHMFDRNAIFNQDLSMWDVGNVTNMVEMFRNTPFDYDISQWDVSSLLDASNMFLNGNLSITNYNALLEGWSSQTVQPDVEFYSNAMYNESHLPYRNILTNAPNNWVITDAGMIPYVGPTFTDPVSLNSSNITSMIISWADSVPGDGALDYYSIYVDGNLYGITPFVNAGQNNYQLTGLDSGIEYNIYVKVTDDNGLTDDSATVQFSTIPTDLLIDIVSYYEFNDLTTVEGSPYLSYNETGNATYDASVVGGLKTTGKIGDGWGYASVTPAPLLNLRQKWFKYEEPFSFNFWTKPYTIVDDGDPVGLIINTKAYTHTLNPYVTYLTGMILALNPDGSLYFKCIGDSRQPTTKEIYLTDLGMTLSLNTWQMVTMTYDGSGLASGFEFYYNGVKTTTTDSGHTNDSVGFISANNVQMDGNGDWYQQSNRTNGYQGAQDEIGVWSRQLLQSDVTELYNGGAGLQYPF